MLSLVMVFLSHAIVCEANFWSSLMMALIPNVRISERKRENTLMLGEFLIELKRKHG